MLKKMLFPIYMCCIMIITYGFQAQGASIPMQETYQKNNPENIVKIARGFLPPKADILEGRKIKLKDKFLFLDMDGDGKAEAIVFYKNHDRDARAGVMILKKSSTGKWYKLYEYTGKGSDLNYLKLADFNGDGKKELLVGWHIGAIYNQLDIFSMQNGRIIKTAGIPYSRIEVYDMQDIKGHKDGLPEIALWLHDTGEAYTINIYRLQGTTLVVAKDVYPNYFKKIVLPYYKQKSAEMPGAAFYLYYLADSQIKGGDPRGALYSIQKGLNILSKYPNYYPDRNKFESLKSIAENMLTGNY